MSYLPMMDDSSEKATNRDPNRDDERVSHSTRAPHLGNSADPDYGRFLRIGESDFFLLSFFLSFFFLLHRAPDDREHPAFSRPNGESRHHRIVAFLARSDREKARSWTVTSWVK